MWKYSTSRGVKICKLKRQGVVEKPVSQSVAKQHKTEDTFDDEI